eukprot:2710955-Rhodomonas_salina.1
MHLAPPRGERLPRSEPSSAAHCHLPPVFFPQEVRSVSQFDGAQGCRQADPSSCSRPLSPATVA